MYPLHKVALLVGVKTYSDASPYRTLHGTKDDLATLHRKLRDSGFSKIVEVSSAAETATGDNLRTALQQSAAKLSGYLGSLAESSEQAAEDVRMRTLAVVYCTGHGQDAGLVASNGDVVPFAFFQRLVLLSEEALWNVFLVDACRDWDTCTSPDFRLGYTPTPDGLGYYALGNACASGYTAQEGLYTTCLDKAWHPNTSVLDHLNEATDETRNEGQTAEITFSSGDAQRAFSRFSFTHVLPRITIPRVGALLASDSRGIIGRDNDLQKIRQCLGCTRLCCVLGGPGEGKTTLARKVGLEMSAQGALPGGAFEIDLQGCYEGFDNVDQAVIQKLTQHLKQAGLLRNKQEDTLETLSTWLLTPLEPTLFILDDADTVYAQPGGAKALQKVMETLVHTSPDIQVIVTIGRSSLPGVDTSSVVVLPPLGHESAKQLLNRSYPALDEQDKNLPELLNICQGNSLMLELVAGLLHDNHSVKAIISAGGLSTVLKGDALADQHVEFGRRLEHLREWMRHVLHAFLEPKEQQQLARLAIFPSCFSVQAASKVAPGLSEQLQRLLKVWTILKDAAPLAGFDVTRPQGADDTCMRFMTMHPFHREVALQLLQASSEECIAAQAGLLKHLSELEGHIQQPGGRDQPMSNKLAGNLLYAEAPNILAVNGMPPTLLPSFVDAAMDTTTAQSTISIFTGLFHLAKRLDDLGLYILVVPLSFFLQAHSANQPNSLVTAMITVQAADAARALDQLERAAALYNQALKIYEKLPSPECNDITKVHALSCLGIAYTQLDPGKAEEVLSQALNLSETLVRESNTNAHGTGAGALGTFMEAMNSYANMLLGDGLDLEEALQALDVTKQTLKTSQECVGFQHEYTATVRCNLAVVMYKIGDYYLTQYREQAKPADASDELNEAKKYYAKAVQQARCAHDVHFTVLGGTLHAHRSPWCSWDWPQPSLALQWMTQTKCIRALIWLQRLSAIQRLP